MASSSSSSDPFEDPLRQTLYTSILSLAERNYCEKYKKTITNLKKKKKDLMKRRKRMSVKTFARKVKKIMKEFHKQEIIYQAILHAERDKLNYVIKILEEEQQATDRLQQCLLQTIKLKSENDLLERVEQMQDTIDLQVQQLYIYKMMYRQQSARFQLQQEQDQERNTTHCQSSLEEE